jgi:hypothetical protein
LVEALAARTSANEPGALRYQIHMVDRPHAITWKEFSEVFSLWVKTHDLKQMDKWIQQHSDRLCADIQRAAQELLDSAIGYRHRKLDDAASAVGTDDYENHMRLCAEALKLIEALVQEGLLLVGNAFYRNSGNFASFWAMIEPWIHFRKNSSDRSARLREREFLLGFAQLATNDPVSFLAVLKPWDTRHSAIAEQERLIRELVKELASEIEPVVADRLLARFSDKGGINPLWKIGEYIPEKWVLFSRESPLWRTDRRNRVMTLLSRASSDSSVHGNALELIHMMSEGIVEGIGIAHGPEKIKNLIEDREISGAIWKAATARPVQYRSLSRIKTIRDQFVKICGTQDHLPVPGWMEAWEPQSDASPQPS